MSWVKSKSFGCFGSFESFGFVYCVFGPFVFFVYFVGQFVLAVFQVFWVFLSIYLDEAGHRFKTTLKSKKNKEKKDYAIVLWFCIKFEKKKNELDITYKRVRKSSPRWCNFLFIFCCSWSNICKKLHHFARNVCKQYYG